MTTGKSDFPAVIAREFARRAKVCGRKPPRMRHATKDREAAFRKVPTASSQYTTVAVWNENKGKVVHYVSYPATSLA